MVISLGHTGTWLVREVTMRLGDGLGSRRNIPMTGFVIPLRPVVHILGLEIPIATPAGETAVRR